MTIKNSTDSHRIFVFGSNLKGRHGAGAALHAYIHYGALEGKGQGLAGRSYAIPTKDANIKTLPLITIATCINTFIKFVREHPIVEFNMTQIGCGLAGYDPEQIAPLFKEIADDNWLVWFDPTWRRFFPKHTKFWSHPI